MESTFFQEDLDKCRDYSDIFDLVKKAVKKSTGRDRAGLMLYLGNLPIHVGGYHGVGGNGIVLNRKILQSASFSTITELNSYVFMLLLHEYLHSLGYLNERQVQQQTYEISRETFGEEHPVAKYARNPSFPRVYPSDLQPNNEEIDLEIIKDFDRSKQSYIN